MGVKVSEVTLLKIGVEDNDFVLATYRLLGEGRTVIASRHDERVAFLWILCKESGSFGQQRERLDATNTEKEPLEICRHCPQRC